MKKVLFIATVLKHHIMAFHLPYLEWFRSNGYEVHIAAKNDSKSDSSSSLPFCDFYYDLPFSRSPLNSSNIVTFLKLREIINSNNFDIIHCHTPIGGLIGRLSSMGSRKSGTKVLYTAHGFHFYNGSPLINWLVYYPIELILSKVTDVLITINSEDYEISKRMSAKRIEYVPGVGVDFEKIRACRVDKFEKRIALGIETDDFLVVSVGELNKNKNHRVIIEAIAKLDYTNLKYIICGQGEGHRYLEEMSKKLCIKDSIKFLGYRDDIHEILSCADVFMFPSYREGLSLALMEAMASKLPVICSNIRGNRDLISDSLGGFLVNPGEVFEFSSKIQFLYKNREYIQKFGIHNFNKVEFYDIKNVKKKIVSIYQSLS